MNTCLYIGNLPHECTEERLRQLVETDGRTAEKVTLALDRKTGRARGFGFVEMGSEEAAAATMEALAGAEMDGRPLKLGSAMGIKKGTGGAPFSEDHPREPMRRGSKGRRR